MRKIWGILLLLVLTSALAWAQTPGRDSVSIAVGPGKVTIEYGTPELGGRNLSEMVMPGFAWRIGMNTPTTIESTVDLAFYSQKLKAGKYSLFARPDQHMNWVLLISSDLKSTVLDGSTVVLEVPLQFNQVEEMQDLLKISMANIGKAASLIIAWGNYRLHGTFQPAS
jgi:hypothetical protein